MLGPDDSLPFRPRRVLVAGLSGAGKSTLADRIADTAALPRTELDALYHGPGWVPRESFEDEVESFTARARWVTEWQYRAVRTLLAQRAELLVWLDLPFLPVVLPRLVRRTVRRRRRKEVLWNGNVEPPLWSIVRDREHVVRWTVATRGKYRELVPRLARERPGLTIVRLRSSAEVEAWLAGPLRTAVIGPSEDA
jgi:adenylate kinase family enzyme